MSGAGPLGRPDGGSQGDRTTTGSGRMGLGIVLGGVMSTTGSSSRFRDNKRGAHGVSVGSGVPVSCLVCRTVRFFGNHGLAIALLLFCGCGVLGVLYDVDHVPNIVDSFLGRVPVRPGRPLHFAGVVISGSLFLGYGALYLGLLAYSRFLSPRERLEWTQTRRHPWLG